MAKFLKEADSGEYKCQLCKKVFCGEEADRKLADHLVSNKSELDTKPRNRLPEHTQPVSLVINYSFLS